MKSNVCAIRYAVEDAVEKWSIKEDISWKSKVLELRKDILNIPNHVFGDHKQCREKKCDFNSKNYVQASKKFGFFQKVEDAIIHLSQHSESLLHKVTNNKAEEFNSLGCHILNGKRVNYSLTNQYNIRIAIAVVHYNEKESAMNVYKNINKKVPKILMKVTNERLKKNECTKQRRLQTGRKKNYMYGYNADKHYGDQHADIDKSPIIMNELEKEFMNKLKNDQENRKQIERDTIDQRNSPLWHAIRKNLITASHFKTVCAWNPTTSCVNKVNDILYPPIREGNPIQQYGIDQEEVVKKGLKKKYKNFQDCGLFIDEKLPMIACSPDGLIGNDGLIEIKCPYLASNMTVEDAIKSCPVVTSMFNKKIRMR